MSRVVPVGCAMMRRFLTGALLILQARSLDVCIGQDYWSVRNYTAAFGPPRAVMSYASIGNLSGLWSGTDYGSGVEHADRLLADMPDDTALQLGLELKGFERPLAAGDLDGNVDALRAYVRRLAPRKVFVRIGYEFDNPGNEYVPLAFVPAYARVAAALGGEPNAVRVWHSWAFEPWEAAGVDGVAAWFPGVEHVDWCGVSVFQQAYGDSELGDLSYAHAFADFCDARGLPLMIAESAPFGAGVAEPRDTLWRRWFAPTLAFARTRDVKMWSYIDSDWDAQPMWRGEGWGDTRLETDDALAERWRADVLGEYRNATFAFYARKPPARVAASAPFKMAYVPVLVVVVLALLVPATDAVRARRAAFPVALADDDDAGFLGDDAGPPPPPPFVLMSPEATGIVMSRSFLTKDFAV